MKSVVRSIRLIFRSNIRPEVSFKFVSRVQMVVALFHLLFLLILLQMKRNETKKEDQMNKTAKQKKSNSHRSIDRLHIRCIYFHMIQFGMGRWHQEALHINDIQCHCQPVSFAVAVRCVLPVALLLFPSDSYSLCSHFAFRAALFYLRHAYSILNSIGLCTHTQTHANTF